MGGAEGDLEKIPVVARGEPAGYRGKVLERSYWATDDRERLKQRDFAGNHHRKSPGAVSRGVATGDGKGAAGAAEVGLSGRGGKGDACGGGKGEVKSRGC